MVDKPTELLLALWPLIGVGAVYVRWKRGNPGVGLVAAYLVYLAWIHWVPALLYHLPWYIPLRSTELVELGFEQSLVGATAFAFGAAVLGPWLEGKYLVRNSASKSDVPKSDYAGPWLPWFYVVCGVASFLFLEPTLGRVPTLSAFLGGLSNLLYAGLALHCWRAWQAGQHLKTAAWLSITLVWPAVTVASRGFLGMGFALPILLFLFVARLSRRPYGLLVVSLLGIYVALSVSVSYSLSRELIRGEVWSEDVSIAERASAVGFVVDSFEWFDPFNAEHLDRVDLHTNQNYLVGSAIRMLEVRFVDHARGATIGDAILMLVPRVLWPDKPIRLGGSEQVAYYTGLQFGRDTSIGMGQVMEFYVNFGTAGVVVGFVLMGIVTALVDGAAARRLHQGNEMAFALWYVPGVSLLQTGNTLIAVTGGSVSSWLVVYITNRFLEVWRRSEGRKLKHLT
jgi:hypothetical protein